MVLLRSYNSCGNYLNNHCSYGQIEREDSYKYLGVQLYQSLNWLVLDYIKSKLRKFDFRIVNEIFNFFEINFANSQYLLLGGIMIWGCVYKSMLSSIDMIQKSLMKAVLRKSKTYSQTNYSVNCMFKNQAILY